MVFSAGPLVKAGSIIKAHGFDGKVKISLLDNIKLSKEEPIFLQLQGKPVPFFITAFGSKSPDIISIGGIDAYDDTEEIIGEDIYVSGSDTATSMGSSLIGYEIIDSELGAVGVITDELDQGFQILASIVYNGRQCLIPMVDAIFINIDHQSKLINAELPQGILDLQDK